jgi:hypothetical protein
MTLTGKYIICLYGNNAEEQLQAPNNHNMDFLK